MEREAWFAGTCHEMMRRLPGETVELLRSLPDLEVPGDPWQTPDLVATLMAVGIARQYSMATQPDQIAAWVDVGPHIAMTDVVTKMVVPVCELFRRGDLPFAHWWEPDELMDELLRWWTRWRLVTHGKDRVMLDLVTRWKVPPLYSEATVIVAREPFPEFPTLFSVEPNDESHRPLYAVAQSPAVRQAVSESLARYPAALFERADHVALATFISNYTAVENYVSSNPEDTSLGKALTSASRDFRWPLAYVKQHGFLSKYEVALLKATRDVDHSLTRVADHLRHKVRIDVFGVNALPDRVAGHQFVTQKIQDYVKSNGRILRTTEGPITHWVVVFDDIADPDAVRTAIADPDWRYEIGLQAERGHAFIDVDIPDGSDNPGYATFQYDKSDPSALPDLAMLVLTRRARLDIFALDADDALVPVLTVPVRLRAELIDIIERRIELPLRVHAEINEDRAALLNARMHQPPAIRLEKDLTVRADHI